MLLKGYYTKSLPLERVHSTDAHLEHLQLRLPMIIIHVCMHIQCTCIRTCQCTNTDHSKKNKNRFSTVHVYKMYTLSVTLNNGVVIVYICTHKYR